MRLVKYLLTVMALLCITTTVQAADKETDKVYVFGFAASFNDSTVYFTDIQEVKGAYTSKKTKFLVNREEYSYQLRDYLKTQGNMFPTCVTCYAYDFKNAEKKWNKLRKKYADSKGRYILVDINSTQFQYRGVSPEEGTVIVDSRKAEAEARKSMAKEHKKNKKKSKRNNHNSN